MDGDLLEIIPSKSMYRFRTLFPYLALTSLTIKLAFRCVHLIHAPLQKHSPFDSTPTSEISSVVRFISTTCLRPYAHITCKTIGRFSVTSHTLGCGSFATVHLAIDTRAHRQVACKVLTLRNIRNKHDMEQIKKEIDILAALDHVCALNLVY